MIARVLNELPTLVVGWLATRGVDLGADGEQLLVQAVEAVLTLAVWLLVRRRTDGPVTVMRERRHRA